MPNRLAKETSPYLKLHAENPVDWFSWGEEALTKAQHENKPILLSIGYTACHWCHVMAHESFEDKNTADLMNRYFINIKVDREERPDIDKIYQLAAQLLTRQVGGWPLTIFLMPTTQIPFFAGTYFPKVKTANFPSFQEVLTYIHRIYTEKSEDIQKQNVSFQNILKDLESQAKLTTPTISFEVIEEAEALLKKTFDHNHGGFGTAPKFPMTAALERFMLATDEQSSKLLTFSLKQMTSGGLYDHLGGGFFRYTVDESWQIPHFEKMLYDNAQLLSLMIETSALKKQTFLENYIFETAQWLLGEMRSKEGGFYATLSADTEGEEGKYYIWDKEEIKKLLTPDEYQVFKLHYGTDQPPNFKHQWHLHITNNVGEIAELIHMEEGHIATLLKAAKQKLFLARQNRAYPMRDEKIIVAWNGLVIKALAQLAILSSNECYIDAAQKTVDFIRTHLWRSGQLSSVYKDGRINHTVTLDDYVFLIEGIFYLLQARWRSADLDFLNELIQSLLEQFEDKETGGFYYTPNDHEKLIYRIKQYSDDAIPASNAICAILLQQIGYFLSNPALLESAERSLKNALPLIRQHPDFYCTFVTALQAYSKASQIIVIRGKQANFPEWQKTLARYKQMNRHIFCIADEMQLPASLNMKKSQEGKTIAYICEGTKCYAPITNLKDFENEIQRLTGIS